MLREGTSHHADYDANQGEVHPPRRLIVTTRVRSKGLLPSGFVPMSKAYQLLKRKLIYHFLFYEYPMLLCLAIVPGL